MKRQIKNALLHVRARCAMPWDLARSRSEGKSFPSLRSVCCSLGPNRNLTSLVAGMMASHPQCRVLNHAGMRVLPSRQVNFLRNDSPETFERFVQYAVYLSSGGMRGNYGGAIRFSHAFDKPAMRELYETWAPRKVTDTDMRSLYWKESAILTRYIREKGVRLEDQVRREPRLRFLMPVRNPLDCAVSNVNTRHARFLDANAIGSVENTLDQILGQLAWFLRLKDACPGYFFTLTERDLNPETLRELAAFLDIDPDPEWITACLRIWNLKPGYAHEPPRIDYYRERLDHHFGDRPDWRDLLAGFAAETPRPA